VKASGARSVGRLPALRGRDRALSRAQIEPPLFEGCRVSKSTRVGCVNSVAADLQGDSAFAADAIGPQVRRLRRGPAAKAPPPQVPDAPSRRERRVRTRCALRPRSGQLTRARTPPSGRFPCCVRALGGCAPSPRKLRLRARANAIGEPAGFFPRKSPLTELRTLCGGAEPVRREPRDLPANLPRFGLGVCSAGRCGGCFGRERQDRRV
jgi:hypothetical protein